MKLQKGFTLVELMVTVGIIAVLAAVGLQSYQSYSQRAANNACLLEAKAYVSAMAVEIANGGTTLPTQVKARCSDISNLPFGITSPTAVFPVKTPGVGSVTCTVATTNCSHAGA